MKSVKSLNATYTKLLSSDNSLHIGAGRNLQDAGRESHIVDDIFIKASISKGESILDIGCGYSIVTREFIKRTHTNNNPHYLLDLEEIVSKIDIDFVKAYDFTHTNYYTGYFLTNLKASDINKEFDVIIVYGVLMYLGDHVLQFIDEALKLMSKKGRLFLGDIANISKKGRFLSSDFGRKFDASYKGISFKDSPHYENSDDYINKHKNDEKVFSNMPDDIVAKIFLRYRNLGYEVYVLPQGNNLPYCYTREDILIVKHY